MKLSELKTGRRYWLWQSSEESWHHLFLKKEEDGTLKLIEYELVDSDTQSEDAWNDFDSYARWKEAVMDGDTEDSYETFRDNIDIWDYVSCSDMYDCPDEVYDQLDGAWYLSYWEYPNYYNTFDFNPDNILDLIDEAEDNYDEDLMNAIRAEYKMNQITFIKPMPIR